MKKILVIYLFLFALPSFSQVVGTTAPGAQKSATDYNLTDQERYASKTYIHQGLSKREMEQKCKALDDPAACRGMGKSKILGVDSNIIIMISKVYSMFSGVMSMQGGGGFTAKPTDKQLEADPKAKGEKQTDYCQFIPAAGEMVGMTMQTLGQQQIALAKTKETPQKATLYKASRSHLTRAKTAQIQGITWGTTTACYAAYMATGGIVIDWKVAAKAGGAALLTAFWLNESKNQKHYASEVQAIADALPGKGDCNPYTEKNCYCSQPETQYDTANCIDILNKKIANKNSYSVPCVNKDLKADVKCSCVGQQNCFDSKFFSDLKGTGMASFGASSAGKNFRNLTNGILTNGKLSSAGASTNASARRLLKDLAGKVDSMPSLSQAQKNQANSLSSYGIPRPIAALIANQKANSFGKKKAASLTSGRISPISGLNAGGSNRSAGAVLRFNSTKSNFGSRKKSSRNSYSGLLNKFKRKGSHRKNSKVLKFAQRAAREAQITKNKDRPIFEIISRRYQVSGWRRLEIK